MTPRTALVLLVLAGPSYAAAPPAPAVETLLPAPTQVYVRWTGVEANRDAYRRSAFGKMLAGELGRSARVAWAKAGAGLKARLVGDKLLEGTAPHELVRRQELADALLALPPVLAKTGFVVGFEASVIPSPGEAFRRLKRLAADRSGGFDLASYQWTVIVPGAKDHPEAMDALAKVSAFAVKEGGRRIDIRGRSVSVTKAGPGESGLAWWLEGRHLVIVAAPGDATPAVGRVLDAGRGVTANPLYRTLVTTRPFDVTTRGFVDGKAIASNVRWLRFKSPLMVAALEDSGLMDVEGVRIWEGFEGEASRARWEVDLAPKPRGICRILVNKPIDRKSLPPIPEDVQRWTAGRIDPSALFELFLTVATASSAEAPQAGLFSDGTKAFADAKELMRGEIDVALGVRVGDLFASMGDAFFTHCSPGDGLSSLGQVLAVSVKDERKLARTMDALMSRLVESGGEDVSFRKSRYHGVPVRELRANVFPVGFAYTVHKGWLVLALNPQPVQGFILRDKGKLGVWKPDARTAKALATAPADAGLVQVVDPRPSVNILLTVAPLIANMLGRNERSTSLPPDALPHAGAVTKHLFPNVSWTAFDGKTWRIESRESLWLPLQEFGLEWMLLLAGRRF